MTSIKLYLAMGLAIYIAISLLGIKYLLNNRAELKLSNENLKAAIALVETSKKKQLASLEALSIEQAAANKKLTDKLIELEKSDEKVSCPVPDFMRNTYRRVHTD